MLRQLKCWYRGSIQSPLACKEIKPVHPKGNQSWIFIRRTDGETEAPILWPPDGKSWLTGKDPDAGKDWRQEEKGMTENEMAGWYHWLHGHEFEKAPGDSEGQGSLVCCSPWGRKESDRTEWLNNSSTEVWTGFRDQQEGSITSLRPEAGSEDVPEPGESSAGEVYLKVLVALCTASQLSKGICRESN